jgi:ribonuclease E
VVAPVIVAPEVKAAPAPVAAPAIVAPKPAPEPEVEDPNRPKRSGWWAKAKQALGGS